MNIINYLKVHSVLCIRYFSCVDVQSYTYLYE